MKLCCSVNAQNLLSQNYVMPIGLEENINTWISQLEKEYKVSNSVDCVIFGYGDDGLKVLALECNMPPFEKLPSLVGDLVRPDENLDEAAKRILDMRTGIKDLYLEQVSTFSDIGRHPLGRVISTAYYALINVADFNPYKLEFSEKVKWISTSDLDKMAFDHFEILNVCITRLRQALRQKPIGFSLLPSKFTLKQLQSVYEVILDVKLDKRNFRRKLKKFQILKEHKDLQQDVNHRPAKYYSFDLKKYNQNNGYHFQL